MYCSAETCSQLCSFLVFGLVYVPIAVFGVSAFFAAPLFAIECQEAKKEQGLPAIERLCNSQHRSCPCSFYEWWKYILSNLTGLANPLTNVGPESGHWVSEVIDLLVAVYSLTICGLIIGIVGNLTWVNAITERTDKRISERMMKRIPGKSRVHVKANASTAGMNLKEFKAHCLDQGISASSDQVHALFDRADTTESGIIDEDQVEKMIGQLRDVNPPAGLPFLASSRNRSTEIDVQCAVARMDAMDAKLDAITRALVKGPHDSFPFSSPSWRC